MCFVHHVVLHALDGVFAEMCASVHICVCVHPAVVTVVACGVPLTQPFDDSVLAEKLQPLADAARAQSMTVGQLTEWLFRLSASLEERRQTPEELMGGQVLHRLDQVGGLRWLAMALYGCIRRPLPSWPRVADCSDPYTAACGEGVWLGRVRRG